MSYRPGTKLGALALVALASLLTLALAASGNAAVPGCAGYRSQGEAQDAFVGAGGGPGRNLGNLDPDRDGVACEALPAPYKGYATIGYNRKRQFFYGTATMPQATTSEGPYPCMFGDRIGDDAPRKVNVFRVTAGGDRALLGPSAGRTAQGPDGRLLWKADKPLPGPGRYYASFEERIRTDPYGPTDCPGFSSRPTLLPRPQR